MPTIAGMMGMSLTRFAVVNRLSEPEGLKDFDDDGYAFAPEASEEKRWVFRRRQ